MGHLSSRSIGAWRAACLGLLLAACGGGSAGTGTAAHVGPSGVQAQLSDETVATAWVHLASDTTYPEHLGSFGFNRSMCFDPAERDCAADYMDQVRSNVTMYVFPVEGRYPGASDPVDAEFRSAANDIALVRPGRESSGSWDTAAGRFPTRVLEGETLVPVAEASSAEEVIIAASLAGAASGAIQVRQDGPDHWLAYAERSTYLVLTRVGPWYVKWRYTRRGAPGPEQGELGAFLAAAPVPNVR